MFITEKQVFIMDVKLELMARNMICFGTLSQRFTGQISSILFGIRRGITFSKPNQIKISSISCLKMKIVTWNVNGIRSFDGKWKERLKSFNADIVCVQETKVTRDLLDEETALIDGYTSYFAFSRKRSGYSGVATFCNTSTTPIQAEEGLTSTLSKGDEIGHSNHLQEEFSAEDLKNLDAEGRCILTMHEILIENSVKKVAVFNLYCPRADVDRPERIPFQLKFYKLVEIRAKNLIQNGYSVIILGDLNVSHKEIDHCDPYEYFDEKPSRRWMDHFLLDKTYPDDEHHEWKLVNDYHEKVDNPAFFDAFRYFHPDVKDAFTCWNTSANCRATNFGTRIDYILVSNDLKSSLITCDIHPDIEGSDHCPVSAEFAFTTQASAKIPSICTRNFAEFQGSQQKLSSYFFKAEKRKLEMKDEKPKKKAAQSQISNFFIKTKSAAEASEVQSSTFKEETIECKINMESVEKRVKAASAWKQVLKGPPTAPLCKGHNEVCALRTVKKKGPNMNRQFWCCQRGEGRANDPNARCDFFKWLK